MTEPDLSGSVILELSASSLELIFSGFTLRLKGVVKDDYLRSPRCTS